MFNFLRSKEKETYFQDFSWLGTDMHSHLIPGIDDGADTLETAIGLVDQLKKLGFQKIITTPHVMADLYPNTKERILEGLSQLKQGLEKANLEIDIEVSAEYFMDEQFEQILANNSFLPIGNNLILVEMGFISAPPGLHDYLFEVQAKGYHPILAHPERYLFLRGNMDKYERLKEVGCRFQLNLLSLTGYYGRPVKDVAFKLLKHNLVDYLGTDLHHQQHLNKIKEILKNNKVRKALSQAQFANHLL